MRSLTLLGAAVLLSWSAQATIITLGGALSPANENPAVINSNGTGSAFVTVDTSALTITFNVVFSGLSSPDTAAHIHCCVAPPGNVGVATAVPVLPGFPMGVTSGSFNNALFSLLDSAFYNPAFVTANGGSVATAEPVFLNGLLNQQTYFNIHTSTNPGGEVRAFLVIVPEPATFLLAGISLLGLAAAARRRR
jgi:CHRD domain/PEP-CTERM motif